MYWYFLKVLILSVPSSTASNKLGREIVSSGMRTRILCDSEDVAQEQLRETEREPWGKGHYRSAVVYLVLLKEFKLKKTKGISLPLEEG